MIGLLTRNAAVTPSMRTQYQAFSAYFEAAADTLLRGRPERGAARRRLRAGLGHAVVRDVALARAAAGPDRRRGRRARARDGDFVERIRPQGRGLARSCDGALGGVELRRLARSWNSEGEACLASCMAPWQSSCSAASRSLSWVQRAHRRRRPSISSGWCWCCAAERPPSSTLERRSQCGR